jgi:oligopeptidase B
MKPPRAPQQASIREIHGKLHIDDYAWLQDKTNEKVLAYLQAENAYADEMMKDQEVLRETLYQEMKGRIQADDQSDPVMKDDFFYYSRTVKDCDYRVYCRRYMSMEAEEEVLLDGNHLAKGHEYFQIGVFEVSPDHQLLAYAIDTDGSEQYRLFIKNLQDNTLMMDQISFIAPSVAWAMDSSTLFYVVQDETMRPYRVMRHHLGTRPEDDQVVFREEDERFFVDVKRSKNDAYILIESGSKVTTEVLLTSARQPDEAFLPFLPREQDHEYEIYPHHDAFYIRTNWQAENFRLVKTAKPGSTKDEWEEVIPHDPEVKLEGIDEFERFLAVYERARGITRIRILPLFGEMKPYQLQYEDAVYTVLGGKNPDFNSESLRFVYTSLVRPLSVFDHHMRSRKRSLVKETKIPGGYDHSLYTSERIEAPSEDGTLVPISLVYKKGIRRDGNNPTYLYAYGSYGITTEPYFSSNRLSLLDRGFIFAIAHIRGSGDLGEGWYKAGKLLNKKNTFLDFIACASHLIEQRYTSADHLCAMGGSAGGLLMGAVMNMRPELFIAIVAKVPFVDVLNTMLDPNLPLTVTEYEEWGNPQDKKYFDYIQSYSPYDNIKAQAYPHLLITAGINDPRVSYWEPAKWTAKLRSLKTDDHLLLLKTNMDAGHGGASGRYEYLKEIALEYAFLLKILGLAQK